jgi:sensor histidine kinase regulating citrate/malate metabolism
MGVKNMDIPAMLELISVQRHDFLNHLQVISGLLQLNKGEKVRDYIREISQEIGRLSRVSHIKNHYVAAALLLGHHRAELYKVAINYNIHTDMEQCSMPGGDLARVLYEFLSRAAVCLASSEAPGRIMNVTISETEKMYLCSISLPEASGGVFRDLGADIEQFLLPFDVMAGLKVSGVCSEMYIILPRG